MDYDRVTNPTDTWKVTFRQKGSETRIVIYLESRLPYDLAADEALGMIDPELRSLLEEESIKQWNPPEPA